jgi:hypothetical protein
MKEFLPRSFDWERFALNVVSGHKISKGILINYFMATQWLGKEVMKKI